MGGNCSGAIPSASRAAVSAWSWAARRALGVACDLGTDGLAVVGQGDELGHEGGTTGIGVEPPQRPQRVVGGDGSLEVGEVLLRPAPEDLQEQVVHGAEVVVHELRLEARARPHPSRGHGCIALVEQELLGGIRAAGPWSWSRPRRFVSAGTPSSSRQLVTSGRPMLSIRQNLLSGCTARRVRSPAGGQAKGDHVERLGDDRLLQRRVPGGGPLPLLRPPAVAVPRAPDRQPRRGRRLGLRGGDGDLPRHGDLLLVQLGDRPLCGLSGAARGRRRRSDHRQPPGPAAHERAHGDHGPTHAHPGARPGDAPAHAEAPQGERGVHVAGGRSADRRVHCGRPLRVHQRLHAAVRHAGRRRRSRRARSRPPALPGVLRLECRTGRGRGRRRHRPQRCSKGSMPGSPPTSKTGGANPATTR